MSPAKLDNLKVHVDALVKGEVKKIEKLLMEDIRVFADGGNKVKVIKDLILGRKATMKVLLFVYTNFQHTLKYILTAVNHEPAICFYDQEKLIYCAHLLFVFCGK